MTGTCVRTVTSSQRKNEFVSVMPTPSICTSKAAHVFSKHDRQYRSHIPYGENGIVIHSLALLMFHGVRRFHGSAHDGRAVVCDDGSSDTGHDGLLVVGIRSIFNWSRDSDVLFALALKTRTEQTHHCRG
jgi:hypothetical protein